MVSIFLDNSRTCPDGFVHVKGYEECIKALLDNQGSVSILCLDNHLGKARKTGRDVALWMTRHLKTFPKQIFIHTANHAERAYIYGILTTYVHTLNIDCVVHLYPYQP